MCAINKYSFSVNETVAHINRKANFYFEFQTTRFLKYVRFSVKEGQKKTISEISPDRILYIARIFLHLLLCSANHSAFQVGCQPTLKKVEVGDVRIRQEVKLKKDLSEREIVVWGGVNNQTKKKENLVKSSIRWRLNEIQYLLNKSVTTITKHKREKSAKICKISVGNKQRKELSDYLTYRSSYANKKKDYAVTWWLTCLTLSESIHDILLQILFQSRW